MRRTGIALTALVTLVIAFATSGSGALAISTGPLSANPSDLTFGNVGQGAPQTITETLTNNGTVALNIQSVGLSGPDQGDFSLSNDSCTNGSSSLTVGASCNVDVTFAPSTNAQESASLDITDDDNTDGSQQSLSLAGTGVTQFSLSGGLTFPDQLVGTTSGSQPVTVTNNTDYSANPSGPNASGDFNATGCGGTVTANSTCSVNVTFTPTGLGTRTGTLSEGGQSVNLTGNGVAPNASLTPGSVPFGNQPVATTSGATTLTLTNNGTAPLTYTSTTKGGTDPGDFSVSDTNCAATGLVAPNAACTITVAFVPTTTGSRTATVVVHDGDPQNPTQTVTVSGNGTPSSVGFGPSSVTFVTPIPAGTGSPVHRVTVSNTTSNNLPITGISIAGTNPLSFIRGADTCTGKTLTPSGTCTVNVQFAPTAAGLRTALLQVSDSGPIAPHSHQVTLTGTGLFPNNPKSVRGTVGCSSAHITWVSPTATRYAGTRVVRNRFHYPTNPGDGKIVTHRAAGAALDNGLRHFTTYYYRVFARYHSLTRSKDINYSTGVHFKERTGEICTPQNGARLRNLTPDFTWLPYPTQNGYAFVLQHGGETMLVRYPRTASWQMSSSWRFNNSFHRFRRGLGYTFYLFAYPRSHREGILIGQVSFSIR